MTARLERHALPGVELACLVEGDGPTVVLVHGFPDTAHGWDRIRPALAAAGYRAVAPFTRGYAPSSIPADGRYDMDTLGRDLVALIDALGPEPVVLVGHDWGATASYAAATLAPEKVRLLVTIAIPHPAAIAPSPRAVWGLRHFFVLRRRGAGARLAAGDFAYVDELVRRWSPEWRPAPDETRYVKEVLRDPACREAVLGYYRAIRPWPTPVLRRRVRVPTVTFVGREDLIGRAVFDRARTRFDGPYEVVETPGGHFLHREHPELFCAELLALFRRFSS